MNLWCSTYYTLWTEAVLSWGMKCPFKDCLGRLTGIDPTPPKPACPRKAKPSYPLLEKLL